MTTEQVSEQSQGVRWGYARVSTGDQDTAAQETALREAGCRRVWVEEAMSGARADRPQMADLMQTVQAGDVVVVVRIDRWARSLSHLVASIDELGQRGVGFVSLADGIDTSNGSPVARLTLHLLGAIAEYERQLIKARTRESLAERRRNGQPLGRPAKLTVSDRQKAARLLARGWPMTRIAREMGVSRATVYRALASAAS